MDTELIKQLVVELDDIRIAIYEDAVDGNSDCFDLLEKMKGVLKKFPVEVELQEYCI